MIKYLNEGAKKEIVSGDLVIRGKDNTARVVPAPVIVSSLVSKLSMIRAISSSKAAIDDSSYRVHEFKKPCVRVGKANSLDDSQ